jgi:uncharacterized membrane protein
VYIVCGIFKNNNVNKKGIKILLNLILENLYIPYFLIVSAQKNPDIIKKAGILNVCIKFVTISNKKL